MQKYFHTTKTRTVIDRIPFTKQEFIEMMNSEKPSEIYNGEWSDRMPFLIITEYNKKGCKSYCNSSSDKTPAQKTFEEIYYWLRYQGLDECYIESNTLTVSEVLASKLSEKNT